MGREKQSGSFLKRLLSQMITERHNAILFKKFLNNNIALTGRTEIKMKLLHISDLHLGKRLNDYSLIDDQREVLKQAVDAYMLQKCEGVIIAGDIYDKSVPSAEAMKLFNLSLIHI